jgi:hypothetical protein
MKQPSDGISAKALEVWFPVSTRVLQKLLPRPLTHILSGVAILFVDYFTGAFLQFPFLFILPVTLSAWFCSRRLAYALAVLLPAGRFLIAEFVERPGQTVHNGANGLIRILVLGLMVFLVDRVVRQAQHIKVLRGLLPICIWCNRIRNEQNEWVKLESYVVKHSDTSFTHGCCPECAKEQYGKLVASKRKP